jgi:DNA-binding transcriptional regulator YiaG
MRLKYKSEILKVLYEDALGLFEIGAITEEQMRETASNCLMLEPQPKPKAERTTKRALASASV